MCSALATAKSLAAKRGCISGSPPERVKPPFMVLSPVVYLRSSARARPMVTGIPLDRVQVSGLWQYWHRNMQEAVQATRRIPGPSTAEPVVKEWRKPTSPLFRAARTSASDTLLPWSIRISNGLAASSTDRVLRSCISGAVEGAVDDVEL